VAAASSACVLVSFASLLVYTFAIFLKPLAAEFGWSREAISTAFGVAALAVAACSPPLGWLRSLSGQAHHSALYHHFRMRVRFSLAANAPSMAPLRDVPDSRRGGKRHRATGLLASADHMVPGTARRGIFRLAGWECDGCHGSSPHRRSSDPKCRMAGVVRDPRRHRPCRWIAMRFPRPRAFPWFSFGGYGSERRCR